jgi:hypothetical protein
MWPEEKKKGYIKRKNGYKECELKELEHPRNINESRAFY